MLDRALERMGNLFGDSLNNPSVIVVEAVHDVRVERENANELISGDQGGTEATPKAWSGGACDFAQIQDRVGI